MGACLSCLGLSSQGSSDNEPSETSRLLNSGPSQPQYGAPNGPAAYRDVVNPEQEGRERDTLNGIWKSTSDTLIDISSATTLPTEHAATGAQETDFARMFRETFPRFHGRRSRSQQRRQSNQLDGTFSADGQQQEQGRSPSDEQDWLRNIILKHPEDKTWDFNTVRRVGKPLIIEFDEFAGKNEGGAVKALKDVKERLK